MEAETNHHVIFKILGIYIYTTWPRLHQILYSFNWISGLLLEYNKEEYFLSKLLLVLLFYGLVYVEMLLNHYVSWLAIKKTYIARAYMIIKLPRWITCMGVRVRSNSVGIYVNGYGLVVWFASSAFTWYECNTCSQTFISILCSIQYIGVLNNNFIYDYKLNTLSLLLMVHMVLKTGPYRLVWPVQLRTGLQSYHVIRKNQKKLKNWKPADSTGKSGTGIVKSVTD